MSNKFALPFQPPVPPMLAGLSDAIPRGAGWFYEPKWDGFRGTVFWDGSQMLIQSRDLKPLGRYFPELEESLKKVLPVGVVVDGEVVIATEAGLDFDALLLRIHPAASRVRKLAEETPSSFIAFDLLASGSQDLREEPFQKRRRLLEKIIRASRSLHLTPITEDYEKATDWFSRFEGAGLDGIVAKRAEQTYVSDQRVMVKIKHKRTADCVVGGFRWAKGEKGKAVGSLLLGLYRGRTLHYVGHTSSFKKDQRRELVKLLKPYRTSQEEGGFGKGRTPGGPSRWSQGKDLSWESMRPELVCEVTFDHLQGDRFRHGTTFVRWRPDKPPHQCTFRQFETAVPFELNEIFKL